MRHPAPLDCRAASPFGGSRFRADEYSDQGTTQDRPFVELHYLDGTEQIIASDLPDSLPDVTLESGHTREGYVYFLGPDDEVSPRPEAFTLFWYGDYLFELPIHLQSRRLAYFVRRLSFCPISPGALGAMPAGSQCYTQSPAKRQ